MRRIRRRMLGSLFRAGHGRRQIAGWAICSAVTMLLLALGGWTIRDLIVPDQEAKPVAASFAASHPSSFEFSAPQPESVEPALSSSLLSALEAVPLHSSALLLTERESGKTLFAVAPNRRAAPASITKVMTALVAIERLDDLDAGILLSSALFVPLYQANASMAGFSPEETVAARDLLYAALLPSAAEAATGLAIEIAGDEAGFVTLMNERAASLGMTDTHFANVTGLDDPNLYSTASDLSTLLRAALENETFRTLFTTARHQTAPTALHPNGLALESTLFSRIAAPAFAGGTLLGGKTGTTEDAGMCLASLAKIGTTEYLLVTLGASGDPKTEFNHISDHQALYEALASSFMLGS